MKYLVTIRGGQIFEFKTSKQRKEFISILNKSYPEVEYAISIRGENKPKKLKGDK